LVLKISNRFYTRYPTRDEWLKAKIERCAKCLGIDKDEVNKNKSCSATIDWLIAGYAVAEKCLLITDDRGIEFEGISCKTKLETLEQGLHELFLITGF